jgi:voltage-gated potassium channel
MSKTAASLIARSDEVAGRYVRRRYAILFYLLLFTFVASPVLTALNRTPRVIELLLATTLSVAVLPMGTGNARRVLLVLVVIAVSGRLLAVSFGETFSSASHGIFTLVGLLAAANALRSALRATSIDSEHIYAALSAYLLAGLSFGVLYWALEHAWPGSLYYGGNVVNSFSESDGVYFSFVTLATLGYGDFVPKTDVARGLVILEAVAGQLYLGVMVARLVSLYVSGTATRKQAGPEVR